MAIFRSGREGSHRRPSAISAAVLSIVVLSSCAAGASPTPSGTGEPPAAVSPSADEPSPTPSPSATPEPTPEPTLEPVVATSATFSLLPAQAPADFTSTISCDGDIGASAPVALVAMKTSDEFVTSQELRDYTNLDQPRTACTFGRGSFFVLDLIDARHVLIQADGVNAIVDLPDVRYHWFALPPVAGGSATLLTVSPNLDAVKSVNAPISRQLMMTTASGDTVVAELPAIQGGRCGAPTDSNQADYQLRGGRYYALDQLVPSLNALVVASGVLHELDRIPPVGGEWADDETPLFPIWSPIEDLLYYRVGADVMRWSPESGEQIFMPDTPWFYPTMTADGRYLAFTVDGDLYLVEFEGDATPQLVRQDVLYPVFVNGSQLWFRDASGGGCVTAEDPPERIYDVRTGSEGPSVIDSVWRVWPQTSSNH